MSRDKVMPATLKRLNERGVPGISIMLTVGVLVAVIVFLRPMKIAKLASVFQLLVFSMVCLAVVVMRESRIESYDPGFLSPMYPWMQLFGIAAPLALVAGMGWESIIFSVSLRGRGLPERLAATGSVNDLITCAGNPRCAL